MTTRLALVLLFAAVGPHCFAQTNGTSTLTGSASVGARSLDLKGTEAKFREDLNLDHGLRVFDLHVRYEPRAEAPDIALDELTVDADGLGGEPFESVHIDVRKYGAYRLAVDRRRSEFFYDDTILPAALASVPGSTGGDYHRFDFERVRDTADLDIELTPATQLSLGLEHQARTGASSTTLTVERDEFDFDRPLDESLSALTVGVRHAWRRVTVVVTEELRDFENTMELVLPGASIGRNPTDAATLTFFSSDDSYDYASRSHAVRVLSSPTSRLDVTALWRREDLDAELHASEQSIGTAFSGAPFAAIGNGRAQIGRESELGEVELGFGLTERLRMTGAVRHSTLDQAGDLTFGAGIGASDWAIAIDALEAGVEIAVSSALTVAAGWATEERGADADWTRDATAAMQRRMTQRDGYFARLALATERGWHVTASVEDNSFDVPYTLASATDSRRYKVGARRRFDNGLSFTAGYRKTDVANDESGWLADTEQADLRFLYRRDRLQASAGYTRIDLARGIDQLVTAGTRALSFVIDYETAAMLRDASARWQTNERFAVGGEARTYDAHGSVRVSHDDLRVYGELAIGGDYAVQVAVRNVDYTEDAFDAYDAEILEVALRFRW